MLLKMQGMNGIARGSCTTPNKNPQPFGTAGVGPNAFAVIRGISFSVRGERGACGVMRQILEFLRDEGSRP